MTTLNRATEASLSPSPARPRIAAVSDVALGFGSPQLPSIMLSLIDKYDSDAVIFEPDIDGRPPKRRFGDRCRVERLYTAISPYDGPGRIEYAVRAADELNRLRPEVVVLLCTFTLPVLFHLNYRPKTVIYWSNESIASYGHDEHEMNQLLADKIDIVLFAEENRARIDGAAAGLLGKPTVIVYNVADRLHPPRPPVPAADRRPRVLYAGTVSRERTLAHYLLNKKITNLPIDVYGPIDAGEENDLTRDFYSRDSATGVSYKGVLTGPELAALRREYAYSIVMWAPINDNQRYAAPNKFFEAIADGVPPIAAPHPQCETIIRRYDCGILMNDWSLPAFTEALDKAIAMIGTPEYERMVENCRRAYEAELNWDHAFAAIERAIDAQR